MRVLVFGSFLLAACGGSAPDSSTTATDSNEREALTVPAGAQTQEHALVDEDDCSITGPFASSVRCTR